MTARSSILWRSAAVGAWLIGCAAALPNAAASTEPEARAEFLRAHAAAVTGAPGVPDSEALRAYPLYPYLQRARIIRALAAATALGVVDDDARAFLAAHEGEPVAAELRRSWLRSLSERGHAAALIEHYRPGSGDAALHCRWLDARITVQGNAAVRDAVVAEWLAAGRRLPPECEPVFAWARAANVLTADLIEQRVRLLLDNGETRLARTVAQRLPPVQAAPLLARAELLDRPTRGFDSLFAAGTAPPFDDTALLAAWRRLARAEPAAALERFDDLRRLLDRDEARASPFAQALALGLAWDRRADDALATFRAVADADFDANARAWQARAALWAGDWRHVERSIEAMTPEQSAEPRWRYWRARAAAERGDDELATEIFTALLPTDNFYAASAAARLGRAVVPHLAPLPADDGLLASLDVDAGLARARELLAVGMRAAAVAEWLHAVGRLTPAERTQAVHLASRWQWHDVAVATATRQSVFFDYELLYPRPYDAEIAAAAELTQLEPPLLYGIVRQESLFRADAVSSAGAMGLAQLLPATARDVARNWRRPTPRPADLLDPATNVTLAAAHFANLVERFGGQRVVAIAAYNAGMNAAARWLPGAPLDADVWIENIPFNETRDYVQRVLWHRVVFAWLEGGAAQDFAPWLAPITPRRPTEDDANAG